MALNFIKNFIPEFNESEADDIGFGDSFTGTSRLIRKDGHFNIVKKGKLTDSLYQYLLDMSWPGFFLRLTTFYFLANSFFALIIMFHGLENIKGATQGTNLENFSQALFFSIQTYTTVGYGQLSPTGVFANLLSSLIAFSGLLTFALATGLFFARFSRPVSHIIFSENMLIGPNKEGKKALLFRLANGTTSQLIDVEARVTVTWIEQIEGVPRRKFQRLDLEIEKIFMFPLNWTVVHPINENSPLYKEDMKTLSDAHMEVLILIRAYDETYNHYIHSRRSYACEDIKEGFIFQTMYDTTNNLTILHLDKINETDAAEWEE